ncbi:uncharacterized protein SAMN02745196_02001 [Clostridium collagenovorans DSM 3089]|uniref:Radical SAM core domain-containing protein n=1 Tax=Clostridium collagenovorans DSM 3089 TaxID=1121306 RepID=A0A1M5X588_9CLOT|nr:radical SAM protein [Clostridium collagenovorans]SHH94792.1 uncharacterized protein SAMN02745196_02001 [Clostridium collagenovorans DSM 3089]
MRGFIFETDNKNKYFYNDVTGNVDFYETAFKNYSIDESYKDEEINSEEFFNASNYQIERYLMKHGFQQLILMITEDCNLRCKYCIYSENYDVSRNHGKRQMKFEVAEKAVRKYFDEFIKVKSNNPFLVPRIGFYGGEPLMNLEVILKTVELCKEIYPYEVKFNITTNAVLLDDDIIKFLIENKFALSVSLNGDKHENDRLRVFPNSGGTYDIIMKKLLRIKELEPEYYKNYCSMIITFDTGTSFKRLNEFIENNKEDLPIIAKVNPVSSVGTTWYDQYSKSEKEKQKEELTELRNEYTKQLINGEKDMLLTNIFGLEYFSVINRINNIELKKIRPEFMKYTGACIPGTKLAIDTLGNIHCCERVGEMHSIGDVDSWISYDKINDMLFKYKQSIMKDCSNCCIQRLCDFCYCHVLSADGGFSKKNEDMCKKSIDYQKKLFSRVWTIVENAKGFNKIIE